jgi:SAM-dependent methyltransferase
MPWLRGSVLDVGCGLGRLAQLVADEQMYVGIDGNESRILHLQETFRKHPKRRFYRIDVESPEQLAALDTYGQFDCICLLAVIEHLTSPKDILTTCHRLLGDDGVLVLTTPTRVGDLVGSLAFNSLSGDNMRSCPHVVLYTKATMAILLSRFDFVIDSYRKFELGMNQLFVCSKAAVAPTCKPSASRYPEQNRR